MPGGTVVHLHGHPPGKHHPKVEGQRWEVEDSPGHQRRLRLSLPQDALVGRQCLRQPELRLELVLVAARR
jgi:hypothetical protein